MVTNCDWGVTNNAEIHYAETRPMPINIPKYSLPFTTGCSGFATIMAKWSGAADPNGYGFDSYGNTDSMLAHSEHISRDDSQPGDFAVFGVNPSTHVVVLVQSAAGGYDALCVSHGQETDPVEGRAVDGGRVAQRRGRSPCGCSRAAARRRPRRRQPVTCPARRGRQPRPQTIEALQWKLRVTTDGVFGPVTKKALQTYLHVTPDGDIGPVTIKALQAHVGDWDGQWGPLTTEALQRALNAGVF